jgi:hypothetical protein
VIFSLKIKMLLTATLFISLCPLVEAVDNKIEAAVTVMSLNLYGWKTMPAHSNDYAKLIKRHNVDILGTQEGVDDWQFQGNDLDNNDLHTNYQRAITLKKSLGQCWQHKFQIYINYCQGNRLVESGRFDLTDGPNATRTGEYAVIEKLNSRYLFVNVHWDHESIVTRIANAEETSTQLNKVNQYPKILSGDFNSACDSKEALIVQKKSKLFLLKNAGIDYLFVKDRTGKAKAIVAYPSDHPSIVATLITNNK